MKNPYRFSLLTLCTLLTIFLTSGVATADITTFTASLSGANEVPPNSSTAVGTAILTVDSDGSQIGITLYIEFTGLSSAQTGAHVHNAGAGANGPVIHELPLGSPLDTTFDLGGIAEVAALQLGNLYVNIHTAEFPGGEIRGQLLFSGTVGSDNATWGSIKALFH